MEFYHNQLKVSLLNEKKPGVYQRADWLVDKLGTKMHSYFGLDEYSEKDDFARYWKDEWVSGLTSWRKALKIPDSDVVMDGRCAKVTDQFDRVRALIDMLRCPTYDCLIRDHAVSLAVSVQRKIDGLVNLDSCQTNADTTWRKAVNSLEQLVVRETNFSNQDRELVNENRHIDKDMPSPDENNYQERDRLGLSRGVTGDFVEGIREESKQALNSLEQQISVTNSSNQDRELMNESDHMDNDAPSLNRKDCQGRHEASGSHRVASDESLENGDRIVNNAGSSTSKSPPSIDVLTDQGRHEHNSIMDVEPSSINIPPSGKGSMKQCAVTNKNIACNKDPKPSVISNTADASTDQASDSQMIDRIQTLTGTTDDEVMKPKAVDSLNSELLPSSSSIAGCIEEQPSGKVEIQGAGSCKKPSWVH
ncbi:hypothetical protein H0E87_004822 [Populus deltoides]|uniref:Uncharacterized protein n=1 Tax=Populus deltoides TaxID=3696 RepID=A0A8T2ZGZ2_POPDE|nr:hypothetical protein H0E87_004822 [Populus deltoides]